MLDSFIFEYYIALTRLIVLPNGDTISASSKRILPISSKLSTQVRTAMILLGLNSASLISIDQLCDDECNIYLNKKTLIAVKDKEIILEGTRNHTDGLWDIPVQKSSITEINHTIPKHIHPGLYIARETSDKANKIPYIVPTTNKHKVGKELQRFNELVDDNIFDNLITKQ